MKDEKFVFMKTLEFWESFILKLRFTHFLEKDQKNEIFFFFFFFFFGKGLFFDVKIINNKKTKK